MSRSITEHLVCPRCAQPQAVELWEWINASLDPGLRDEVVSGEINRFECDNCAYQGQVERPLLYLDPGRDLVLYAAPADARHDPELADAARADAERLLQTLEASEALDAEALRRSLQTVYGYQGLAGRVLAADALEALEDVLAPDDPAAPLSPAAAAQLDLWRDLLRAEAADAFARIVAEHRDAIRMPLLSGLFSAIGRAARGGDPYLADYLRDLGDRILAALSTAG